jgi:hypothetical protein
LAPLSEILGREMETIGSGETRNTIKTIPSKITFLSQNDFRTKDNVSQKQQKKRPLLLLFHQDLSL